MKKQIIITLEVDSDDEYCMMDAFIKDDLATEIGCCSNFYEIKDIRIGASAERTGRWIDTGSGQECSECHEIQYGYDNFRYFCAFCGARMVE